MKHKLPISFKALLLLLFCCTGIKTLAQNAVNFTQSNLPIVIISTDVDPNTGQPMEIPDEPKIAAGMKIIYHTDGTTNYVSDQNTSGYLNYNGRIKIEIRGSSSQDLPKKQYSWTTYENDNTTKKSVSIMGMPKEKDWILNGLAFDPSLMRDYIAYNLSRAMGYYTTRTQYCEVIINGVYKGLYIIQEKLKDDSNRINIQKIDAAAASGVALTGGYITKADKTTGGDPVAWTMSSYNGTTDYIHELPKPADVTVTQNNYIYQQFNTLSGTSRSNNTDLATGYPSVIDIPTFVDFMVMNELASNVDGYQISTYFHKDIGGKLRAGPIWDFNLTFGNDLFMYGLNRSFTDVWQFDNWDNTGSKFWLDLYNSSTFRCYLSRRWHQVTAAGGPLSHAAIETLINNTTALIGEAAQREQQAWGTVPNWHGEVNNMKSWIQTRISWITNHIGSHSACDNPVLPSLVINGISYHPATDSQFTVSEDLEFIRIKNTGTTTVNLTGVYLRELGVSYQFPANSTLEAGAVAYIANNAAVFQQRFGFAPFGEFQRDLSNNTQNLVLADGMGDVIDAVQYDDEAPWPDADGSGFYLNLADTTLDNSLGQNWSLEAESALATANFAKGQGIVLYPNPAGSQLNIKSTAVIESVSVYDVFGKLLLQTAPKQLTSTLDLSNIASGIYMVKVTTANGAFTQKILHN
ncbi:CotH kinase family protein [Flavobacterium sp. RNTU_13]|uniref:CotH kinase family protein n=1 Tax=Flavobacterium sp. RNTU_13 TaxID=3375145 RepID=UPI003985E40D